MNKGRRGISNLTGLILVIPVIFIMAVFVTSISTTLYQLLVIHHAMGAAIRQISIPLSANYSCNQSRIVIKNTFEQYGLEAPGPNNIRFNYIRGDTDAARDGVVLIVVEYDVKVGTGLTNFLSNKRTLRYAYEVPVERYNARYINAWTDCY